MRICRYIRNDAMALGFYLDDRVLPLEKAQQVYLSFEDDQIELACITFALDCLPHGDLYDEARRLWAWLEQRPGEWENDTVDTASVRLLAPVPAPRKIILLAGNYAEHIEEEGQVAVERSETFPYLFMKPVTCLNHPNAAIPIPRVSPDHIDYEAELGVVIGKRARHVSEADALDYVAGYVVVNDISDRQYKPNPERRAREKDAFFDWLHGKWHDGFCPVGPCIASAEHLGDPQDLPIRLSVNGEVRQDSSTARMIYPVAAIIEFISRSITLEPGDIIATGTPAGIGATTGTFLKPGDRLDATIERIGTLHNVMAAEEEVS